MASLHEIHKLITRSTMFTLTFLEAKSLGEGTDKFGWCCFTV